ncbi:MAG TPA: hypothetical protein VGF61_12595 [Candidatus Acidoferrum sp.]|jgi:hypothetical protein
MKTLRIGVPAALNLTNSTPVNLGGISILFVASYNATLATNTLPHVKVESILFTLLQCTFWNAWQVSYDGGGAVRAAVPVALPVLGGHQKGGASFFRAF